MSKSASSSSQNLSDLDRQVNIILQKMFSEFDQGNDQRFSKRQFPKVIRVLTDLTGGQIPFEDDVVDLFNLLDVNGDQSLDKEQCRSLFKTFFKVLNQNGIKVNLINNDII